jgi:hypothetical protein
MPGSAAQMGSFARAEREKWGRVVTLGEAKLDREGLALLLGAFVRKEFARRQSTASGA